MVPITDVTVQCIMLAVVKKPRIELSIHGEHVGELILFGCYGNTP